MSAADAPQAARVSTSRRPIRKLAGLWAMGTGIAVLLVTAAHHVATGIADPLVVAGLGEVTLPNVIGFTIFGATVGAVVAHLIGHFGRRPRMAFLAVALIALAGYAVVPFTAAESAQTAIWLNILHLVVAIPVVGMLARYLPGSGATVEA